MPSSRAQEGKRRPYEVKVVYEHENRDLAILAVDTDLPFLKARAEDRLSSRRAVIVIGNPGSVLTDRTNGVGIMKNAIGGGE